MILFIDDEPRYVENIKMELEFLGRKVKLCSTVDAAIKALKQHQKFEGIVCDVMMPPGKSFRSADTEDGRRTGLLFADWIRAVGIRVPIVVLSNDNRQYVKDKCATLDHCKLILKRDYPSFEIAERIAGAFAGER